jgi:hypothetical protein
VHVDPAWGDEQAVCTKFPTTDADLTHGGDPVAVDRDICGAGGATRAVDEAARADHEVMHLRNSRGELAANSPPKRSARRIAKSRLLVSPWRRVQPDPAQ